MNQEQTFNGINNLNILKESLLWEYVASLIKENESLKQERDTLLKAVKENSKNE